MAGKKVLVVDDEKLIVKGIRFSLEQDNMEVDCAYDGEEALQMAHNKEYDIILLDVMLPKLTGFEVCQQIREFSNVPIVMLTAKGEDMDKILGLEYGADDYITKPFNILEVKARIKAIMRRAGSDHEEKEKAKSIQVGDLRMDCEGRRVFIAGKEINLTAKEFDLLELMALDFAIDELGLYLTTHADDQQALELYWSYIRLGQEGRKRYQEKCGPLMQTDITPGSYQWLNDPWPWDGKGN